MGLIDIVVVEDQAFFAEEYAERIASYPKFNLLATYATAGAAVQAAPGISPHIAIIDIGLPDMPGYELISCLKGLWPNCQFLVCSVHNEDDAIFNSICCGATGYLLKSATKEEFLHAIEDLHNGGSPMSFHIARKVLEFLRSKNQPAAEAKKLTPREFEIVEKLAKGLRYKEIATALELSQETVRKHINNIYRKLEVQSRTDAINKLFPR